MRRYVFRRPFDYQRRRVMVVALFPTAAPPAGVAPTGALYGSLAGPLGGPV